MARIDSPLPSLPRPRYAGPVTDDDGPWAILAGQDAAGTRLDRFLTDAIGTVSRSRVKSLIDTGAVALGGSPVRDAAQAVQPGQRFTVSPPPAIAAIPQAQAIPLTILYEDSDLLVLDKPPGLVVHPAPGNQDGTLVNALLAHCGDTLPGIGGEKRPGIVHRLDKDTSGVMVVAKTDLALAALGDAFARRDLDRAYLALCWGIPAAAVGTIEAPIGRDPRDRKRMAVVARGGKPAMTHFRVCRTWFGALSLVQCRLATGRTHQIRVHLAQDGHPIVGDPVYLRRIPAAARLVPPGVRAALLDFPRQALHAASLGFRHPRTGAALHFTAPLPPDFAGLLTAVDPALEGIDIVTSILTGPG